MAICENLGRVVKNSSVSASRRTRSRSVSRSLSVQWNLSPKLSHMIPVSEGHNSHWTSKLHIWLEHGLSKIPLQNTNATFLIVSGNRLSQLRCNCSIRESKSGRGMYFEGLFKTACSLLISPSISPTFSYLPSMVRSDIFFLSLGFS